MPRDQIVPGEFQARSDDRVRDVGQFRRKLTERGDSAENMPHIHAEHLAIFEIVETLDTVRGTVRVLQQGCQFGPQLLSRFRFLQDVQILEEREHLRRLQSQKIVPEEIADPE